MPGNYITAIREDQNGVIWLGTYGNGIIKTEQKNRNELVFTNYDQNHGLSNNVVYCIEIADDGKLWISTDNGLSLFDPATETFKNYFEKDGLLNNQFYWSASFKDHLDNIYFGGINGINYFHPSEIADYPFMGKVKFIDFKIFNTSVKPNEIRHGIKVLDASISKVEHIKLSHRDNIFSIEFSALDYFLPEKIFYAYKMEGMDANWVEVDHNRRFASYTSLKGGDYVFKVKSTNSDGVWSEEWSEIKVSISPPFYLTTWFMIIVMISIMMLVMAYIRFRTLGLLNQKKILEKQVCERTAKISSQTEDLKIKNQMLEQRQLLIEGQKNQLEKQNIEISDQRDQLIRLNKQVEEINHQRIRFFTNISHEFRTPLMLIIDPIENLINQLRTDKKVLTSLNLIQRNANRLLNLINQLMYFRRIELKKLSANVSIGNIDHFINEIYCSFDELAAHRQITYNIDQMQAPIETWFDREKLEIILYNLISNAFKFTPENKTIQLRTYYLENEGFWNIVIEVKDNGIGIAASELEHIFDRFYQSDSYLKNTIKSSGIGLALTHELVEVLKGKIVVESEPQKGSTFILSLPCSRNAFTDEETDNEQQIFISDIHNQVSFLQEEIMTADIPDLINRKDGYEKRKPLILFVEDNPDLRKLLYQNLESEYRIILANNGKEGLKLASKYTPDLVVSDVMMPEMDGIELCKMLKSDIQTCHIPIIILTAKALIENWIEGLETGADDYIPKPFNIQVLKARIKNLIENRKMMIKLFSGNTTPDTELSNISPLDKQFIRKAYEILDQNFKNYEFTIEQFAGIMCVSKSLLYKKLRAITGLTISDFISKYRINKSLELLREGVMSISDIAYKVGFNDPKYYSRVFKKTMGMPPTEYTSHL